MTGVEESDMRASGIAVPLRVSSERLFFIVVKAREFDAKVPRSDGASASNPTDDGAREVLDDVLDGTAEELQGAIDQLSQEEQADLTALVWTGRGDFDRTAFAEARALAHERQHGPTSRYLMGIPNLSDLIEEGVTQLGHSFEEYELGRL
jgi:hypothetical protein